MTTCRLKEFACNATVKNTAETRPYIALEHVEPGLGKLAPGVELEETARTDSQLVEPGDVLFGKLRPYLAKVIQVDTPLIASPELLVIRPRRSTLNSRFLYWLTLSRPFVEWGIATSVGVKMPRTDWSELANYRMPVPPQLEQQQRITDFLDRECQEMESMISESDSFMSLVDERDHLAISRLVTGSDVPGDRKAQGPWWLPQTPVSWKPLKIARNFKTGSGTTPTSTESGFYGGKHPWLNSGECRDGVVTTTKKMLTDAGLKSSTSLKFYPPGSIVVAMYGATIGRLAMLGKPMTVNQACVVLYEGKDLDPWFTFWWMWAHRNQILGLGVGGGQPNISQDIVRQISIPAPSLTEQRRIVELIDKTRDWSSRLREQAECEKRLLLERRQTLITSAVTGKLEVA
jgi:type I restriction enzyme S subunit